ncbi:MAG TPA: transaldolase [Stellaceae bacterium]|nr:transaldolase [Stellaceae bacterium]
MTSLADLKVKIFADGADKAVMLDMYAKPHIKGLTTNPTLMAKAGIRDYEGFARDVLQHITDKPLSLEVFSDEIDEMEREALKVSSWGPNVYVKIPISNTRGESTCGLVRGLAGRGVKVNVTAIMTLAQVRDVVLSLEPAVPSNISVFAGRIADTGVDPLPIMSAAVAMASSHPLAEIIWASPRELLNIVQADVVGCQIITVTPDILMKLPTLGYNLDAYSLDTVKMFRNAAVAAGFRI